MDESRRRAAPRTFGMVADDYARSRPGYPEDAVRWLVGTGASRVLELGAGTGKLTAVLQAQGHFVVATDPSLPMLTRLRASGPQTSVARASAEAIPLADSSVDAVLAAQAFHWFDHETAVPEIARVLRPGGVLGLLWNLLDESVPWVRRLAGLLGEDSRREQTRLEDPVMLLEGGGLFTGTTHRRFRNWQDVDRDLLLALVSSRSYVADRPEAERKAILARVSELYDEYGRGHDGMRLPYTTECYRARVSGLGPLTTAPVGAVVAAPTVR